MNTIKLHISKFAPILDDMRVFSSMVRIAFNRFQEGFSEKEIRSYLHSRFSVNSWLMQSAVKDAATMFSTFGKKKLVFGGKRNLFRYLKGLISKGEYRAGRLMPLRIYGEARYSGNRLVDFDFIHNTVVYKPRRGIRHEISFSPVKRKLMCELTRLQAVAPECRTPVTVTFSPNFIFITYDESKVRNEPYLGLKRNRVVGIDMNPNYIGVSVLEFAPDCTFTVLHKAVFDLSPLISRFTAHSSGSATRHLVFKLKHETLAVAHAIDRAVNYWKCSRIGIEDLNIPCSDKKKGCQYNRLTNNLWERRLLVEKLRMLSGCHKYELVEINPAYSSVVGNFAYGSENTPDMVAASIEIARRAYKKFEKGWFYPRFNVETRDERWKQTLDGVRTWKELSRKVKESGLKYRFLLADCIRNAVFRKSYPRRMLKILYFA